MTLTEEQPRVERHASWLELFFDLTVVAAAIQVSHRLHDAESLGQVAACGAVFYAVWSVWTAFSVYVNVAGERTRERSLLVAMFGMCVMVASVSAALPEVLPEPEAVGGRTVAFTVAFIMCRSLAAASVQRTGQVIAFWPAAQSFLFAPWLIALFVSPEVRYWLWGLAIVIDLGGAMLNGQNPRTAERYSALAQARNERHPGRRLRQLPQLTTAVVEPTHLDERLGLFVIIVLGEALAQIIGAASDLPWDHHLVTVSIAGFLILVVLWKLVDRNGFSGAPRAEGTYVPPWLALPAHLLVTAGTIGIATGLGLVTMHAEEVTSTAERWYLFGGLAAYLLASVMTGPAGGASRTWLFGFAVPGLFASLVMGTVAEPLAGWASAVGALLILAWQLGYPRLSIPREGVRTSGDRKDAS